ncbi:MAG: DUF58 domain-containing protein [Nitrospirae bacterium]|nr:DUF58 domain-containing protein [Nitrospirota bacterium]
MLNKEILRKVKRLEIKTARLVEGAVTGSYLSTFKGRGVEFTEVREYAEGDDVRAIDWNVTARMGAPYIKTFMEERDITVVLMVDLSGSMDFGPGQTKRELALDFCAAVSLLAVGNNDRVGMLAYTDRVEMFIPPRKGRRHVMRLLTSLAALSPAGRGTDPIPATGFLMKTVKTRATLFWLSDFIGIKDIRPVKAVSRRHELVPVLLRDRLESGLPEAGFIELADPETGDRMLVDLSSKKLRAAFEESLREREKVRAAHYAALRAEPVEVWTGMSVVTPLAGYFRRQARLRRR